MTTYSEARARRANGRQDDGLEQIVRSAAEGDEAAWQELFARFDCLVRGVVRGHGLNEADAADAVQTTWLKLLEHLGSIESPERLGAWLATTARRTCLRILSSSRRQIPRPHEQLETEPVEDGDVSAHLVDGERDDAVRAALRRLPPRRQELLELLVSDPAPSYEQISLRLNMPIGSIGPTRARALRQLEREVALAA